MLFPISPLSMLPNYSLFSSSYRSSSGKHMTHDYMRFVRSYRVPVPWRDLTAFYSYNRIRCFKTQSVRNIRPVYGIGAKPTTCSYWFIEVIQQRLRDAIYWSDITPELKPTSSPPSPDYFGHTAHTLRVLLIVSILMLFSQEFPRVDLWPGLVA